MKMEKREKHEAPAVQLCELTQRKKIVHFISQKLLHKKYVYIDISIF